MLQEYITDYEYDFQVGTRNSWGEGLTARVRTDEFGRGYIFIGLQKIPINLVGKGMSKARKKAIGIAKWWQEQEAKALMPKFPKYLPYQKRASQRAKKKLRRTSRGVPLSSHSHNYVPREGNWRY